MGPLPPSPTPTTRPTTTAPPPTTAAPTTTAPPVGDVRVSIQGDTLPSTGGAVTVTLRNVGAGALDSVTLELRVERGVLQSTVGSGWTCTGGGRNCTFAGPLDPGASTTVTLQIQVLGNGVTSVDVRATGAASNDGGDPGDNVAVHTIPVS